MNRGGYAGLGLVTGAIIAGALSAFAQSGTTIRSCVDNKNYAVRIVPTGGACKSGETLTSWNTQGPAGPQGAPGATGSQGPQGLPGLPGPTPPSLKLVDSLGNVVGPYSSNVGYDPWSEVGTFESVQVESPVGPVFLRL